MLANLTNLLFLNIDYDNSRKKIIFGLDNITICSIIKLLYVVIIFYSNLIIFMKRSGFMEFSAVDTIWVLLGAAMVFLMQAGFAMVETGFTRAKNAGNIIMKNLMDFSLGTIFFWFIGFGIMFNVGSGFIGGFDFFVKNIDSYGAEGSYPGYAFLIFQTVFCATAATIVSGAMAERTKFSSYLIYSVILSAIVYPISGHWTWGGGWLDELGFHDFAGSAIVHMVGGVAAIVGAKVLGPRIDKYDVDGSPKAIPGHSLTLGALGVFILWFCWFGFNGGSTVSMQGDDILSAASIFVTTNISAAVAAASVMIITWFRYKKPDVSMSLNGALAGLVGITAGCDIVSPAGAAAIGLICAFLVVFSIEFVDRVLKIDDPVGAFGVHGVCGAAGTILTGVFALDGGLLHGGGIELLKVQFIGVAAIAAWVAVTMGIVFLTIKKTVGLRVTAEEEMVGLDIMEHGLASSYSDFMHIEGADFRHEVSSPSSATTTPELTPVNSVPVVNNKADGSKMTKVVIVTNQTKFIDLKAALNEIGITGMTMSKVLGYGMQKGDTVEYYRGTKLDATLLPKVKIEVVISKVPLDLLVQTVNKVLYTGNPGDGKIFVYDVENVIKVSTGQQGYDALQDTAVK